jgi:dihydroorotase-like cyclic amidohydrolase
MLMDKRIINCQLVVPEEGIVRGDVLISGGKIAGICSPGSRVEVSEVVDARGKHVTHTMVSDHRKTISSQKLGRLRLVV